jgi:flagellar biosynthesis protein FliR
MTEGLVVYVALVLARVGTFVAVMPPFAARTPRTVRVALALAITAFYLTAAMRVPDPAFAQFAVDIHPIRYALALFREALIGAAMGLAFSLFLLPARVAGEFITGQIGLNISPSASPTGESGGPLTVAFETAAGLLFLIADGHHLVLLLLHLSFDRLPLGGAAMPQAAALLSGLTSSYEAGLLLAGPLALCLMLLAVVLAVMSRAAPQLNVYSIGFTLQVAVALLGTLFLLPEIVRALAMTVGRVGDEMGHLLD